MRVMVVEDSPVARLIIHRTVERLGHEVVVARDGIHAWELFGSASVDVVISDWVMPGIDGLELCRRVRGGDGPYTYFIVLTALADKEHMISAMEAGADDFLVKPLDRLSLKAGLIAAARVTALHHQLADHQEQLERLNGLLHDDAAPPIRVRAPSPLPIPEAAPRSTASRRPAEQPVLVTSLGGQLDR
jgi:DNA-binding response OmpR family regulator